MKDWEIIADNLSKAGWSYGYVSAIDSNGRTIWIADAHRDDGRNSPLFELASLFMRLKHIGLRRKRTAAAPGVVCGPATGKFRISRGVSQRENRRKYE